MIMKQTSCLLAYCICLQVCAATPVLSLFAESESRSTLYNESEDTSLRNKNISRSAGAFTAEDIKVGAFLRLHTRLAADSCESYSVHYTDLLAKGDGTYRVPHSRIFMDGKKCGSKGDNATDDELWTDDHMELMPVEYLANETISLQKGTNAAYFRLMRRRFPRAFFDFSLAEHLGNPEKSNTFVGFERLSDRVCGDTSSGTSRLPKDTLIFFTRNDRVRVNLTNLFPNQDGQFLVKTGNPFHLSFIEAGEGDVERVCPQIYSDAERKEEPGETRMCFPAEATAQLKTGASVFMRDLQVGDMVLDEFGSYSPIYMFSHRSPSVRTEFMDIRTNNGERLTLSPGHYVITPSGLRVAESLQVGDTVVTRTGTAEVVRYERRLDIGLYNPHTLSGSIVVNGVVASVYTSCVQPNVAHALLVPLRALFWCLRTWPLVREALGIALQHGTNDLAAMLVPKGQNVLMTEGALRKSLGARVTEESSHKWSTL